MSQRTTSLNAADVEREELPVDVLLVGAGPANLACAIHLRRLLAAKGQGERTILVIDKAEELGHHTLSGAVMDPRGMAELFPDWRERGCPVDAEVADDWVEWLRPNGKHHAFRGALVPPQLRNHGNFIVSANRVVRWLAEQAEAAGVEIHAGFPAAEVPQPPGQRPRPLLHPSAVDHEQRLDRRGRRRPGRRAAESVRRIEALEQRIRRVAHHPGVDAPAGFACLRGRPAGNGHQLAGRRQRGVADLFGFEPPRVPRPPPVVQHNGLHDLVALVLGQERGAGVALMAAGVERPGSVARTEPLHVHDPLDAVLPDVAHQEVVAHARGLERENAPVVAHLARQRHRERADVAADVQHDVTAPEQHPLAANLDNFWKRTGKRFGGELLHRESLPGQASAANG